MNDLPPLLVFAFFLTAAGATVWLIPRLARLACNERCVRCGSHDTMLVSEQPDGSARFLCHACRALWWVPPGP